MNFQRSCDVVDNPLLNAIPSEMLDDILDRLKLRDLLNLSRCSREMRRITTTKLASAAVKEFGIEGLPKRYNISLACKISSRKGLRTVWDALDRARIDQMANSMMFEECQGPCHMTSFIFIKYSEKFKSRPAELTLLCKHLVNNASPRCFCEMCEGARFDAETRLKKNTNYGTRRLRGVSEIVFEKAPANLTDASSKRSQFFLLDLDSMRSKEDFSNR